jgi:hypothetical protein
MGLGAGDEVWGCFEGEESRRLEIREQVVRKGFVEMGKGGISGFHWKSNHGLTNEMRVFLDFADGLKVSSAHSMILKLGRKSTTLSVDKALKHQQKLGPFKSLLCIDDHAHKEAIASQLRARSALIT